jgi:putative endopeptidase
MWTTKESDQSIRQLVATDNHAPNQYRAIAPLLHVEGFYEAFGIKEGDPMWLAPEKRLKTW